MYSRSRKASITNLPQNLRQNAERQAQTSHLESESIAEDDGCISLSSINCVEDSADPNSIVISDCGATGGSQIMADDDFNSLPTISEVKEEYERPNMYSDFDTCHIDNPLSMAIRTDENNDVRVGNNSSEDIINMEEDESAHVCSNSKNCLVDGSVSLEARTGESNDVHASINGSEHIPSTNLSSIILDTELCDGDTGEVSIKTKSFKTLEQDPKILKDSDSHVEQIHEEDVQENMLLYSSDADCSPTGDLMAAPNQNHITDKESDWPDMDDLALPCDDNVTTDVIGDPESEDENCCNIHFEDSSGKDNSDVISNDSNSMPWSSPSSSTCTSTTKPLKPILHSLTSGEDTDISACAKKSEVSLNDIKTVTFADDTVFNEDKPKRYQKEKIDLKELYRDRICGKPGFGLVNPVFVMSDEDSVEEGLTDDEKVKRNSFRINLVNAAPSILDNSSLNSESSSPIACMPLPDLNTPSYMKKYLTRSVCPVNSQQLEPAESSLNVQDQEAHINSIYASSDIIQVAPVTDTAPGMTARQKRLKIIKGVILVMAAFIIIAIAVGLGILFSQRNADS
ncbi:uncharacterized protein LOC121383104 [Gigantopelta aegis]|uniref:uncharacterized protein LOC121383104 n=1 Tax=Gigantopelta aegis TaxID=1735272 RepID=UPI001B889AC3|nr:uncharacterized protein LOC121383104 [Gigantopelta aegis]XP_041368831.1 uncharacterized protein LOC121383104 [Gigantopelta aegis]